MLVKWEYGIKVEWVGKRIGVLGEDGGAVGGCVEGAGLVDGPDSDRHSPWWTGKWT